LGRAKWDQDSSSAGKQAENGYSRENLEQQNDLQLSPLMSCNTAGSLRKFRWLKCAIAGVFVLEDFQLHNQILFRVLTH
jgi:hypothetical protein